MTGYIITMLGVMIALLLALSFIRRDDYRGAVMAAGAALLGLSVIALMLIGGA